MHPAHRLLQGLSLTVCAGPSPDALLPLLRASRDAVGADWSVFAWRGEEGRVWSVGASGGVALAPESPLVLHPDVLRAVLSGRTARTRGSETSLAEGLPCSGRSLVVPVLRQGEPIGALLLGGEVIDLEGSGPLRWAWDAAVAALGSPETAQQLEGLEEANEALRLANETLEARVGDLARLHHENGVLSELSGFLQASHDVTEVHQVLGRFLPQLFEHSSGAFLARTGTLLEQEVAWGACRAGGVHAVEDCWALRRGEPHVVHGALDLACHHRHAPVSGRAFCMPVATQEGPAGLLHVEVPADGPSERVVLARLGAVAERLGACLTNLRLRERLREESIRDPLTGLFNRRYMTETLQRELARARRANEPVALVMMDVDHFKQLNDRFGHDVGDDVLEAVAGALAGGVRSEDVVCRYGGEEFVAILPGASLEAAVQRAEELRLALHGMALRTRDGSRPEVTMSAGVALAEGVGSPEVLLRAADRALLQAKQQGRDRVCVADNGMITPAGAWRREEGEGRALRAIVP